MTLCEGLAGTDKFIIGQGLSDGGKQVAALGEEALHVFDGEHWVTIEKVKE
jgi:hypothetical protein